MTNARTVLTSLDHLVAEMVAYPFVSTASFACPVEMLDGRMTAPTAKQSDTLLLAFHTSPLTS